MASSTLSARTLITSHLIDASRLSNFRHQLLTTPAHDLLDTATASQLFAATLFHLKSLSTRGYQQLFKVNNIADLVTSPILTLTFYCFLTFLAFHTKTITSCTAYALGLVISLVIIFETYNTIHAMMMRLELTSQHIRTVGTYLLFATDPSGLLISWFGMGIEPGLDHEYSPRVDYMQKEDNAAKTQQHRKEPSRSKTKVQLHNNDASPVNHCALRVAENTKRHQDNTNTYVLATTFQHKSSKAQSTTYKSITPDPNTGRKPNMKHNLSPQIPAIQASESTFQMTLRNSMYRSERPSRTMKSRMSTSVNEHSSQDSYFKEGFRMTVCSEDESSGQTPSGTSTPDSEASSSTTESDFQTGLRMMLGSACGIRKRGKRGRRSDPSFIVGSECPT